MIWTLMSHMPTIVLVITDLASVYIGVLFFSERMRRWSYRKRWGSLPPASVQFDPILEAVPAFHDRSGNLARLRQVGILRSPFEPNAREAMESRTTPQAPAVQARRLTFRRSVALQQMIARRERLAAGRPLHSSRWQAEAPSANLQAADEGPNPYLQPALGLGHIQESQYA